MTRPDTACRPAWGLGGGWEAVDAGVVRSERARIRERAAGDVTGRAGFPPGWASTTPCSTPAGRPVKRTVPVGVGLRLTAIR